MKIQHFETYLYSAKVQSRIPLVDEIREIQKSGDFVLVEDPLVKKETLIIGMFVLRPAYKRWEGPLLEGKAPNSVYEVPNWIYNISTISGGSTLAAGNIMDGFRLGFQYAISDAVIVGSSTVLNGGLPRNDGKPGYMWVPYNCAAWPHMKEADPHMLKRFRAQRKKVQDLGYASKREYPAQIVITQSGKETKPDLLEASIFHERHPNGEKVESYIVTGSAGADALRDRAPRYGLEERIDDILIELPLEGDPHRIDLKSLPKVLYNDYDIRIANHDGGAKVLESFCEEGIIPQFNFTFARKPSLYEVIEESRSIPEADKTRVLESFDSSAMRFFKTTDGSMPDSFSIVQALNDEPDEAAVLVLDTREVRSFS